MSTNGRVIIIGFKKPFDRPTVANMALLWKECKFEHLGTTIVKSLLVKPYQFWYMF
jgi:hypothetical protein